MKRALLAPLGVSALVTGLSVLFSYGVPEGATPNGATLVSATFLGVTWLLVLRREDAVVKAHGLDFAGLLLPGPVSVQTLARESAHALLWAFGFAALFFGPYALGFRFWFGVRLFHFPWQLGSFLQELLSQSFAVAFPEELFYRGYLQTQLDSIFGTRKLFGAKLGPGLLVTSVIFALGHFATIPHPSRLAVFFPSILFGYLRARTGGVGASLLFHAFCNLFSLTLGKGTGLY